MDPIWIAVAFALGFAVRQIGLPPLVGFLAAGFTLHAFGVETTATLEQVADMGEVRTMRHDQFGLDYKPSAYAAERMGTPFSRKENLHKF